MQNVLEEKNKNLKPPLKWAGGKRWLIPHLFPIWKPYEKLRLVEPFCGGLAVTLAFMPEDALLNDINLHLINFYNWIKKGLVSPMKFENDREKFYLNRKKFNELIHEGKFNSETSAMLFYYLNRTGFNGLCRFNNSGEFNVPFGQYKKINYKNNFLDYKNIFSRWDFTYGDFEDIKIKNNDFIYADPPYDVEFTKYSKHDFTWDDQIRLVKWLSKQNCPIVISNEATKRIVSLYEDFGFQLSYLNAPRSISCTGNRTPVKEVIALKNF